MPYRWGDYSPDFSSGKPLYGRDGVRSDWLGGDGGFEAALDGQRSVWTFGDSYHHAAGATARRMGTAVANMVGVGVCQGGAWSVGFYHGGTGGVVKAFFDDPLNATLNTRLVAQKPVVWNGRLYVLLARIKNAGVRFVPVGAVLARVNNPLDPPPRWGIDYLTLTTAGRDAGVAGFGSEALVSGRDLILYGTHAGKVVACKVPLTALEATPPGGNVFSTGPVYYRGTDGEWHPGYQGPKEGGLDWWDCKIPTTSGFSVRHNSALKRWQVVYIDTRQGGGFPPEVTIGTGSGPFGPWELKTLGRFPEMTPGSPSYHPDNACYAAHEVSDFEADPGTQVRLAYTNGSRSAMRGDFARQLVDHSTYTIKVATFANPFT